MLASLKHIEVQYLVELQNKRALEQQKGIFQNQVYSVSAEKATPIQYLYQKEWIKEVWKETHLLSTVVLSEADQEGAKED